MNGKKSALCNRADHSRIPITLSADLQVLSLNENNISYLNPEEFFQNGLEHLQRIYLRKSRVRHIHRDAFKGLKILVEIDLSENSIETLELGTFSGNERLKVLYLNSNPLRRLVANQFPDLPHLRTLDLHNCAIESVGEHAFLRLDQMELLNMRNNSIATLTGHAFSHMSSLKTLLLDENPWNCDCKLKAFRNWYVKTTNHETLTCVLPQKFAATSWDQLNDDQFGCLPIIQQLTVAHRNDYSGEVSSSSNVSFHCLVSGDPVPQIHWELNGHPISEGFNVELVNSSGHESQGESSIIWSNLTIHNVTNYDSGVYSCRASNFVGSVEENATLFLPEVFVEQIIIGQTQTFWYFGLIMGTFSTIFSLLLVSVTICWCRKAAVLRRSHGGMKKNGQKQKQRTREGAAGGRTMMMIKGSESFAEHEKNWLDLSLTTTNDRLDSCELLLANTPSTTMTMNNSGGQVTVERDGIVEIRRNAALFPPPPAEFSCNDEMASNGHLYSRPTAAEGGGLGVVHDNNNNNGELRHQSNQYNGSGGLDSSVERGGRYGNIFVAVSMDNADDVNMYPDLLNIPNRIKSVESSGCDNNRPLVCSSIPSNQNGSEITGGGEFNQTQHPSIIPCLKHRLQELNNGAFYAELKPLSDIISYSSFNLAAERGVHGGGANDLNYCAFATLPRKPRQRVNVDGRQILVNNRNNSSGKFKDLPWAIPENDNAKRNLVESGSTLRRPVNKLRSAVVGESGRDDKLQHLSTEDTEEQQSWCRTSGGGECEDCQTILFHPSQNDNIGRRVTASGNSAIKGTDNEAPRRSFTST